jgi:beta-phosphoglucomutase family hydrolase
MTVRRSTSTETVMGFMGPTIARARLARTGEIAGAAPPRPRDGPRMLDLPRHITTCLFDLDGVLTRTAEIHARAWKRTFGELVGEDFGQSDYEAHVDGRPRLDGARSFLAARGLDADAEIVRALAARKDDIVRALLRQGVERYEGSVRFAEAARALGLRRAVVSSSTHCSEVLEAAGIADLFEVVVDGTLARRERLAGKPAPDTFLAAVWMLRARAAEAAVFEDAVAGVEAARAGAFGWVVGVDRSGHGEALRRHGADVVVGDLGQLVSAARAPAARARRAS